MRGDLTRLLFPSLLLLVGSLALAQPMTALRFTHLSPDAPTVDLVVDNRLFLRDLVYGQVTPYQSLPAGQHEISVYPHRLPEEPDGEEDEGPTPLEPITVLLELSDGMYYTLALSGFYQPRGDSEETGALTVAVEPADATVQISGPRGFARSFSGGEELEGLEPGIYTVRVEGEGFSPTTFETSVVADETTTVSISLQTSEGGASGAGPEIDAEGIVSDWQPVQLHAFRDELAQTPPPGGARVRLLHLSPTTLPVDLLAMPANGGGEPVTVASDLSFPNAGPYVRLPGEEYTLQIRLAGADAILSEIPEVTLLPGGSYSLYLVREPQDNYLRLIPSVDAMISARH